MLTLYVKTGCAFCAMALHKVEELRVPIDEKNIADDGVADELIERGGKRQVPYLVDTACSVEMYESADIVEYLEKRFGEADGEPNPEDAATCPQG